MYMAELRKEVEDLRNSGLNEDEINSELHEEERILEELFQEKNKILRSLEHDLHKEWSEVMGRFVKLETEFKELVKKKDD